MKEILTNMTCLIEQGDIAIARTQDNQKVIILGNENRILLRQCYKELREFLYNRKKMFLTMFEVGNVIDFLDIQKPTTDEVFSVACRIHHSAEEGYIAYEINKDTSECMIVQNGEVFWGHVTDVLFSHSTDYANQVTPQLDIECVDEIFSLIHKHFHFKDEEQEKLFILYLCTSFLGNAIAHPMLALFGEKGSSKSTTLRKIERLIDPKTSDLSGLSQGVRSLKLRLNNTYFVGIDNLSTLSRKVSDMLARAVTGGSESEREFYTNTSEVIINLKSMVAINGVSLVAKESDLLDRSLILELKRIDSKAIKSEQEIWDSFEEDRPRILGCLFWILAYALDDTEPVKLDKMIRMADFHIACVKVGRVIGIPQEEVSELLWSNQSIVNQKTVDEDLVACCILELMSKRTKYINSVSGLLSDLQTIANRNSIMTSVLPKTPNHLSNRLKKVQSNLESEYNISYSIANVGPFKEITIRKRK